MTNPFLENNSNIGRTKSFLYVTLAYIIALAVAYYSYPFFQHWGSIWGVLASDLLATLAIFLLGYIWNNASLYDPFWSVAPIPIAVYWWSLSEFDTGELRKTLLLIVLFYWAIRLTLNWARSWPGFVHEDWRYGMLRNKHGKAYPLVNLGGIHVFPTVLVFLGMLPVYVVLTKSHSPNIIFDIAAFLIGIIAVTIELISDEQLKKFVKTNTVPRASLKTGLWKYSRHPNYFGEVLFWFSMFLFAMSAGGKEYIWTGVGVLAMFLLFWFISIPMMDERMIDRRDNYEEHIKKTSRFFLWPPKR